MRGHDAWLHVTCAAHRLELDPLTVLQVRQPMDLASWVAISYTVFLAILPLPHEDAQAWPALDALIAKRGPTAPVFRDLHDLCWPFDVSARRIGRFHPTDT